MAKSTPNESLDGVTAEVMLKLGSTTINECWLDGKFGAADKDGEIWINPALCIVPTIIHEILHCVRPKWREGKVREVEARITDLLKPEEIKAIYNTYLERKV